MKNAIYITSKKVLRCLKTGSLQSLEEASKLENPVKFGGITETREIAFCDVALY